MRPMMPRDLVLGRACSSHVKVVLLHVLGHANLHFICLMVQVSDITHRTKVFVLLMCPLYG